MIYKHKKLKDVYTIAQLSKGQIIKYSDHFCSLINLPKSTLGPTWENRAENIKMSYFGENIMSVLGWIQELKTSLGPHPEPD